MNHQRGFAPVIIVLIVLVLLIGAIFVQRYLGSLKEETKTPEEELSTPSNAAECSKSSASIEQIITGSFRSLNELTSAGEATLNGHVVIREKEPFGEPEKEKVEKVYVEIAPQNGNTPQANFYSSFIGMVERGNTINLRENDNLLFRVGELIDNGNALSSTADISPLAKAKILSAIKTGEAISLRMQVPTWVAMGAPSDFSAACAIELSED